MKTLFKNARIRTGLLEEPESDHDCLVINGPIITNLGRESDSEIAQIAASADTRVIDVQGQYILPSFFDSHVHLLQFGISQHKIDVRRCETLQQVKDLIRHAAEEAPQASRILCHGWRHSVTGSNVVAEQLDELDPRNRPIYVDSEDLHSVWCNTAAIDELPDLDGQGSHVHRREDGRPSGFIEEGAVITVVWPFLVGALNDTEKKAALRTAVGMYREAGYTAVVDMAMDEPTWKLLHELYLAGDLKLRLAAHFIILPSDSQEEDLANVERVKVIHARYNLSTSPDFRVAGIKLVCDGVVDACTAALSHPYRSKPGMVEPMWTSSALRAVLRKADEAGLQCALHAIGDEAVSLAVNALASLGSSGRRHRIEHLELTKPEDARRLGELGITASIQPVHCDPELYDVWPNLIGHEACTRAFAYREFADHGAKMAIGTDAPTAPHQVFNNIFNAVTRKSFRRPTESRTVNEEFRLTLQGALSAVSYGAAYSCFAESLTGGLRVNKKADFVVIDTAKDWEVDPTSILRSEVIETWFDGRLIYKLR